MINSQFNNIPIRDQNQGRDQSSHIPLCTFFCLFPSYYDRQTHRSHPHQPHVICLSKYRANVAWKNGWFIRQKECLEFNDFFGECGVYWPRLAVEVVLTPAKPSGVLEIFLQVPVKIIFESARTTLCCNKLYKLCWNVVNWKLNISFLPV